ncbi:MAG: type II toxin-antitoxin system VapC family toxin [Solirubrobacteraceae bacterium]
MPLFYADASALIKLVMREPESDALLAYARDADLVSSELVLSEIPRAIRRACALDARLPGGRLLAAGGELLDAVGLLPIGRELLLAAGRLETPALRTLDAIHLASALSIAPLDAFVTYDERQGAAARIADLRTIAPAG